MSHDQRIKNLIADYTREALAFFAPEEAADLPPNAKFTLLRQEQTTEEIDAPFRELDVPVLVEFPDREREAIAFIIEEETKPSRFSIHRLVQYCAGLAESMKTNRVVPVVIFLKRGKAPLDLTLGTERQRYLQFRYLACFVGELDASEYLESTNLVARLFLPAMAHSKAENVTVYLKALEGLVSLEPNAALRRKYKDFVEVYAELSEEDKIRFRQDVLPSAARGGEIMGLFAEEREAGLKQGLQQGRVEGRVEERATSVLRILERRGLALTDSQRARILSCRDESLLDVWFDRAFDVSSVDVLLAGGVKQH